jgi:3-phosphoshikimate 1-carboxyvinyltransferase
VADDLWRAPTATHPVDAVVAIPGSKSITNRALVLAALASGPSTIRAPLVARDTKLMVAGLTALGVGISGGQDWFVTPGQLQGPAHVDCGLAGTVMRFLPPVAALAVGDVRFDGDPRARMRPMAEMVGALKTLGVRVADDGRNALPFTVHGTGCVAGGEVILDATASSQYVSGLLLCAARFQQPLLLRHRGPCLPSVPHIEMTIAMLSECGVTVTSDMSDPTNASWLVQPGPIGALNRTIEPDLSNAAPFLAAAMVTGGRVTIPGWPRATTQPGDALREIFAEMGASVELSDAGLTLTGPSQIHGIDVNLQPAGELTPVIAAVAALARTPSRLRGIGHLRGHETDRLAALAREINRLGGRVKDRANSLRITPTPLHGGQFRTYEDHRMATAGAVLGLVVPEIDIEDVATTRKTLPRFPDRWLAMLDPGAQGTSLLEDGA